MARAAAKRKATPKPPAARPTRAVRKANRPVEETLFFHRIRRGTKWVFALLAVAFAFSFVVAGVGSGSTGFGSVVDALGGLFGTSGGGSGPSVSKALKRIEKNPKDAAAYFEAAQAYQTKNEDISAIDYYEQYSKLRPKDTRALVALAGLYGNQLTVYSDAANQAQAQIQQQSSPLAQGFGPSSSSQLGQALNDPLQQAASSGTTNSAVQQQYQQFAQLAQQASQNVEKTYKRLAAADPAEPSYLLQYARYAQALSDTAAAKTAYSNFVKRFPDDPNVAYAKKQLKALTGKSK
jgi:tetratricopeptide (TPR) repeat protein